MKARYVAHSYSIFVYWFILVWYLQPNESDKPFGETIEAGPSSSGSGAAPQAASTAARPIAPQEDEVDLQLYRMTGNINRQRDDKLWVLF